MKAYELVFLVLRSFSLESALVTYKYIFRENLSLSAVFQIQNASGACQTPGLGRDDDNGFVLSIENVG